MAWESLHNVSMVNSGFEYFMASFRVPVAHNIFTCVLLEEMAFGRGLCECRHGIQGGKG